MVKENFETLMKIIIGTAKRKGASDEEIDILVKAFGLTRKYWPTFKQKKG